MRSGYTEAQNRHQADGREKIHRIERVEACILIAGEPGNNVVHEEAKPGEMKGKAEKIRLHKRCWSEPHVGLSFRGT